MMSFGGKGASIGMKTGLVRSSNWQANVQSYTPLSVAPKRAAKLASLRVQLWGTGKKQKTMTGASGSDSTSVEAQAQAEAVAAEEQAAWVKPVLAAGGVAALLGVAYYLGKKRK